MSAVGCRGGRQDPGRIQEKGRQDRGSQLERRQSTQGVSTPLLILGDHAGASGSVLNPCNGLVLSEPLSPPGRFLKSVSCSSCYFSPCSSKRVSYDKNGFLGAPKFHNAFNLYQNLDYGPSLRKKLALTWPSLQTLGFTGQVHTTKVTLYYSWPNLGVGCAAGFRTLRPTHQAAKWTTPSSPIPRGRSQFCTPLPSRLTSQTHTLASDIAHFWTCTVQQPRDPARGCRVPPRDSEQVRYAGP